MVPVCTLVALRASEAVAGNVGQFLDVTVLVVMGQESGILARLEVLDFFGDVGQKGGHEKLLVF